MDNWQIIQTVKAHFPNSEVGWAAVDVIWKVLDDLRDGRITRDEARELINEVVNVADKLLPQWGEIL